MALVYIAFIDRIKRNVMRDMNLENPLMQNLKNNENIVLFIILMVSIIGMLLLTLVGWIQNYANLTFLILLTIIELFFIYLCFSFHKLHLINKGLLILSLLAYPCYSIWISVNWMKWHEASPPDLAISISGGLIVGFIVAYSTDRIIKGSVSSQEQEVQFSKGQEAYDGLQKVEAKVKETHDKEQEAYNNKKYDSVIKIWKELALIKGHVKSQLALGKLYETDKKDPVKAMEYYSYAAYQGHAGAQFHLAKLYMAKKESFCTAEFWFRKAIKSRWLPEFMATKQGKLSEDEISDAEYNIGKIYEKREEL